MFLVESTKDRGTDDENTKDTGTDEVVAADVHQQHPSEESPLSGMEMGGPRQFSFLPSTILCLEDRSKCYSSY